MINDFIDPLGDYKQQQIYDGMTSEFWCFVQGRLL